MATFPGWDTAVLKAMGAPVTPTNLRFFGAWQNAEGGTATNNPFNTTQQWAGASPYNSVGVRNYPSPQAGIQATVKTLRNGYYDPIVKALMSGSTPVRQLAALVAASPWGTKTFPTLGALPAGLPAQPQVGRPSLPATGPRQPLLPPAVAPTASFPDMSAALAAVFAQNQRTLGGPSIDPALLQGLLQDPAVAPAATKPGRGPSPLVRSLRTPTVAAGVGAGVAGKVIGTPGSGTHTLGNWESDRAIDEALPEGTPLRAPFDGTIGAQFGALNSSNPRMAGLRVHVVGANDEAYLAHLERFAPGIKPGTRVRAGQIIGYSGSANGVAHVHEALRSGNPYSLIPLT